MRCHVPCAKCHLPRAKCQVPRVICAILVIHFALSIFHCAAQDAPNQPLELPEFVITGKESVNIPGGVKQTPNRPPVLRADKLDSLNPIEKLPLPQLTPRPLPKYSHTSLSWPGYLVAEFGNYITPSVTAGYSFKEGGYLIDLFGNLEASSGWVNNSEYVFGNVGASSTYVAPEKFIFFGGSTTVVDLGLGHKAYKLYSDSAAPDRQITNVGAGVSTEGRYEGISFAGGLGWNMQDLNTADRSVSNNELSGKVGVENRWNQFDVGALLDLRLRTFNSHAYPFTMFAGTAKYVGSTIDASARVGVQWATATFGTDRLGAELMGVLNARLDETITATASIRSGLRPLSFSDLYATNPYVADTTSIDAPYDVFDVGATLLYHPTVRFSTAMSFQFRRSDHDPVWVNSGGGMFTPEYRTTTLLRIKGDVRWLISASDVLIADLAIQSADVAGAKKQTYLPSATASAGYERNWSDQFKTNATLVYVGERFADLENSKVLSGYIDARIDGSYAVSKNIRLQARVQNLLGSTIVLWEGYRERGLFISVGITWTF